ncbi:MAG: type II toxin-antitoxin system VapC family toxin [Treponema sp.]|nr:type II toxin-antitoxin system VapC family toxin [Treponema sp.]
MKVFVFDASFVGALIIPDEKNPVVDRMYAKIGNDDERYSPHLLWYEIANIFNNLIKRRRYTYAEVMDFFPCLAAFNLIDDSKTGIEYSKKLLHLCNDYQLSSYDASYLELAERKSAVLCTLDESLRAAAVKYGVAVIK